MLNCQHCDGHCFEPEVCGAIPLPSDEIQAACLNGTCGCGPRGCKVQDHILIERESRDLTAEENAKVDAAWERHKAAFTADLCSDCPHPSYPTDVTRCAPCPMQNGQVIR
jgi:hypothetical protein